MNQRAKAILRNFAPLSRDASDYYYENIRMNILFMCFSSCNDMTHAIISQLHYRLPFSADLIYRITEYYCFIFRPVCNYRV